MKWQPLRTVTVSTCWFAVPFLALWGLGVDPLHAARLAGGLFVVVGVGTALAIRLAAGAMLALISISAAKREGAK